MNSEIIEHEQTTICNEIQVTFEKKYKHKPRSDATLWRYRENGTYFNGSADPDYKNKYYALNYKNKVSCPLCGSLIVKQQISRHQSNKTCNTIQQFLKDALEKQNSL